MGCKRVRHDLGTKPPPPPSPLQQFSNPTGKSSSQPHWEEHCPPNPTGTPSSQPHWDTVLPTPLGGSLSSQPHWEGHRPPNPTGTPSSQPHWDTVLPTPLTHGASLLPRFHSPSALAAPPSTPDQLLPLLGWHCWAQPPTQTRTLCSRACPSDPFGLLSLLSALWPPHPVFWE